MSANAASSSSSLKQSIPIGYEAWSGHVHQRWSSSKAANQNLDQLSRKIYKKNFSSTPECCQKWQWLDLAAQNKRIGELERGNRALPDLRYPIPLLIQDLASAWLLKREEVNTVQREYGPRSFIMGNNGKILEVLGDMEELPKGSCKRPVKVKKIKSGKDLPLLLNSKNRKKFALKIQVQSQNLRQVHDEARLEGFKLRALELPTAYVSYFDGLDIQVGCLPKEMMPLHLWDYVKTESYESLSARQLTCYAHDLVETVLEILSLGYIPYDIKPEDIRINGKGAPIFCDIDFVEMSRNPKWPGPLFFKHLIEVIGGPITPAYTPRVLLLSLVESVRNANLKSYRQAQLELVGFTVGTVIWILLSTKLPFSFKEEFFFSKSDSFMKAELAHSKEASSLNFPYSKFPDLDSLQLKPQDLLQGHSGRKKLNLQALCQCLKSLLSIGEKAESVEEKLHALIAALEPPMAAASSSHSSNTVLYRNWEGARVQAKVSLERLGQAVDRRPGWLQHMRPEKIRRMLQQAIEKQSRNYLHLNLDPSYRLRMGNPPIQKFLEDAAAAYLLRPDDTTHGATKYPGIAFLFGQRNIFAIGKSCNHSGAFKIPLEAHEVNGQEHPPLLLQKEDRDDIASAIVEQSHNLRSLHSRAQKQNIELPAIEDPSEIVQFYLNDRIKTAVFPEENMPIDLVDCINSSEYPNLSAKELLKLAQSLVETLRLIIDLGFIPYDVKPEGVRIGKRGLKFSDIDLVPQDRQPQWSSELSLTLRHEIGGSFTTDYTPLPTLKRFLEACFMSKNASRKSTAYNYFKIAQEELVSFTTAHLVWTILSMKYPFEIKEQVFEVSDISFSAYSFPWLDGTMPKARELLKGREDRDAQQVERLYKHLCTMLEPDGRIRNVRRELQELAQLLD